jgi:hypothetical protein
MLQAEDSTHGQRLARAQAKNMTARTEETPTPEWSSVLSMLPHDVLLHVLRLAAWPISAWVEA